MTPPNGLGIFAHLLMLSSSVIACSSTQEASLFTYRGAKVLASDLSYDVQRRLHEVELDAYEKRMELVRDLVIERYLSDLASRDRKSVDDLRLAYFSVPTISEDERLSYFERIKASSPYSYDVIKAELDAALSQEKKSAQRARFLKMAEQDADIQIGFDKPIAPRAEGVDSSLLGSLGPEQARVSVILFADFACPHCREIAPKFRSLHQKFPSLRFGFRSFLRQSEGRSLQLAIEAECASAQEKFWNYHDWVFAKQSESSFEKSIQEKIGLDSEKFSSCLNSSLTKSKVQQYQQGAAALGISAVPAFFVNGRAVATSESLVELERAIENEIQ